MANTLTHRQRMLAAIRGEAADWIPWAPRMDLWCIAQRARGTLPARFRGLNTTQIADELGVACHAVRGDYTIRREPEDLALRALGIDNHPDHPFRVELGSLPCQFEHEDGEYRTLIQTTAGEVSMCFRSTKKMAVDGISLPFVEKYPICGPEDFEAVARVFEDLRVIPTPRAYENFHDRIGHRGLAVACGPLGAAPIHLLLHDVMAMENFFVLYADDRPALEALAQRMEPFYEAMLDAVLACAAEVIFWGANYDQDTTWAPFFEEQIVPWLQRVRARAHAAGKLLLTHTDGENRGLLHLYPACGFDVGESVCTSPMTSCTLAQTRAGFGPKTAVWGGIPCVLLLEDVMDERSFEKHMDELFAELGSARRLILGVSDNVPPDADLSRLERIKQWIEAFGPVG